MEALDNVLLMDDDLHKDHVRIASEFLGSEGNRHAIEKMLRANDHRLIVNVDEVRAFNRDFATGVLDEPNEYIPAFEKALQERVQTLIDPLKHADLMNKPFYVGLRGSFGDHHVSPRTLRSVHLGKMMSLEGIVTRCEFGCVCRSTCTARLTVPRPRARLACSAQGTSLGALLRGYESVPCA